MWTQTIFKCDILNKKLALNLNEIVCVLFYVQVLTTFSLKNKHLQVLYVCGDV